MPQISVIVLTYNPNEIKLRQTLSAIAAQKDICYELIIGDDGSARKDFSFLPAFLKKLGIEDYQLLEHAENHGTVQNCLAATQAATGKYVFFTSPGDLLFDPYVLRDLYRYAESNHAPLCFGNAVFYNAEDGVPKLTRVFGNPASPQLYAPGSPLAKPAFFSGAWVIGASYFRSRELTLACLNSIADTSTYMEDTPTTAFALAQGETLTYFDRNIVWYEDGTGVSTGVNDLWQKRLHKDALQSFRKLKALYPDDPYVDIAYTNLSVSNKHVRLLRKLLRHPVLFFRMMGCKNAPKKEILCKDADLQRLTQLLKNE